VQAVVIPVTPFAQNCSLVWCPRTLEGAVIDPGGDLDKVLAEASKHGVKLTKILLTHAHIDHAGGTAQLARDLHLPIIGPHPGDQFWIDGIAEQRMSASEVKFTPDRWLEKATGQVGDVEFAVRHCPPTRPGMSVPSARTGGFRWRRVVQGSIGRTDFRAATTTPLIRHPRKSSAGDDVRFQPGHGPMSTFGERRSNPFLKVSAAFFRCGPSLFAAPRFPFLRFRPLVAVDRDAEVALGDCLCGVVGCS
jgi:glyoxylase-like metal-dependent hydrolase (beta-lactamase superfamily II)